jgi:hypothetical protein
VSIAAIETAYASCRFRSRLEARWAVFFDDMGIPWKYEPEGFDICGRRYLPDFYLPESATWIEVKGAEHQLDKPFLRLASSFLPPGEPLHERGPRLMVLGDIPRPLPYGDYGWLSLDDGEECRYGFGTYDKNRRPWYLHQHITDTPWLVPTVDDNEWNDAAQSYLAARTARFEHGQSGA